MPLQSHKRTLILASTSPYRKLLLQRLHIPFEVCAPEIDESAAPGEKPRELVSRLALEKSLSAARRFPRATVIGSDQIAVCNDEIIGKPGTVSNAHKQLESFSGNCVLFQSAFAVCCKESNFCFEQVVDTEVCFRQLTRPEIERYIELDRPIDCAGSFKSEAAGVSLLDSMSSSDPTAIIGLPLITLARALREAGFDIP